MTIALWLGHASSETTQIYLHADLALKERAIARTTPTGTPPRSLPAQRPTLGLPRSPLIMPSRSRRSGSRGPRAARAGADSIDDLDLLRHGGMRRIFGGVRAPSTLGTHLKSLHSRSRPATRPGRCPSPGRACRPGPRTDHRRREGRWDRVPRCRCTIREVHGYAKQGAAYGYSKVRGPNGLFAVDGERRVVAR